MSTESKATSSSSASSCASDGHRALAQLDLADEAGHPAVGADAQVGVEIGRDRPGRPGSRAGSWSASSGRRRRTRTGPAPAAAKKSAAAASIATRPVSSAHLPSPRRRLPGWRPRCARARRSGTGCRPCAGGSASRVGRGVLQQQRVGVQDHPRRAVAALERVVLQERLLDGVQLSALAKPFDGQHVLAGHVLDRRRSRTARPACPRSPCRRRTAPRRSRTWCR